MLYNFYSRAVAHTFKLNNMTVMLEWLSSLLEAEVCRCEYSCLAFTMCLCIINERLRLLCKRILSLSILTHKLAFLIWCNGFNVISGLAFCYTLPERMTSSFLILLYYICEYNFMAPFCLMDTFLSLWKLYELLSAL